MRYLGIDYGAKKIGLALSDEGGHMGFPYKIIRNSNTAAAEIDALIHSERVGKVVIGESRDLAGNDNPIAAEARAFGARLASSGVEVAFEDERFTSIEARRQFEPSEKTRAPQGRAQVDASAAALILTSYLSKHG